MTLLSFGDAVAKSKMSPEKLSVLLDMYGVMHELQPKVSGNNAFSTILLTSSTLILTTIEN